MARCSLALACCVLALACATTASAASNRRFLLQGSPAPGTGEVVAGSEAGTNATAANATNAAPSPSPAMGGAAAGDVGAGSADNATGAENATTAAAPAASLNFNTFPEALTSANGTQANLTILVAALEAANLTNALNETTAWTILAPNDAAFERALKELNITAQELLAEQAVVTALLSYHVIPSGALNSTMLPNGTSFPTALTTAGNLTVLRADQNLTITGEGSNATVVAPDIKAGASVIHVIDTVLLPPPQTEVDNTTAGAGNMTSPVPAPEAAGAAGASPAPADAGASPAPADAGVSPAPADAGASPAPADAGASPAPADAGASPAPAEAAAGASPAPAEAAAGASPAP